MKQRHSESLQYKKRGPHFKPVPADDLLHAFYKGRNALVTGGAGFIGSHIAQVLCKYGAHVTVIDDLSTGSLDNIEPFSHRINFIASDITSFKACMRVTRKQDFVFHTAAFISVAKSIKYPALCEKINVEGTNNLLEAAANNNVSTFIFSSSAAVYGNRSNLCHEQDSPNPQSPYATSKLEGEILCKAYSTQYRIKTGCLRYFNVYGDRQNPHGEYSGVVAKFRQNLINKKPIIIHGNGKQRRDFVHVEKIVEANLMIGTLPTLQGEIFNIATGKSITLFNLLSKLRQETRLSPVNVLLKPSRRGDIFTSQANCEKYNTIKDNWLLQAYTK